MELVLVALRLLERLLGVWKALLELLRLSQEKEAPTTRGRPRHLKEKGRRR